MNLFGNANERELKRLRKTVQAINTLEERFSAMTDEEFPSFTEQLRARYAQGARVDELLPEAFAAVREASRRVLGMRHFDVQLMGGIVLHQGKIAEMKTGEGKTLVATLPSYLNALTGEGVHVVTVNEYLAQRDSEQMGQLHRFLGLTVGVNLHGMTPQAKKEAYQADILYGTNSEFGFDYLRDNMVLYEEQRVQRTLAYAIVDEVDSILVDEARTPLIISGQSAKSTDLYAVARDVVRKLQNEMDFSVDEKRRSVILTESGVSKVEAALGIENLYDTENISLNHHVNQALKARELMKRDRDYVVADGEVVIVDEFTGRMMPGRRYSDGLHQAIEAKEGLPVKNESMTLATITYQNFFRMYQKLAGMTGTAKTEEEEFRKIYGLDVVVIPTHRTMIRRDLPDLIYQTEAAKYRAVVEQIAQRHATGQPVLVGTTSIENSELLSRLLKKRGIPHQVLNAKYHAEEAQIVALAGHKGTVTIATNMAGRGTDIVLGTEVPDLGGLHILGTERHESRRIDNQLRGRSGRQGDPGSSQFYLSLEDELMRKFGSDNIKGMMGRLGLAEDDPIESKMVTRAIENAQKKVEANNFEARRQLLQYDDVLNQQRDVIYRQRREVLQRESLKEVILGMGRSAVERTVEEFCPSSEIMEEWDLEGLLEAAKANFLNGDPFSIKDLWKEEASEIVDLFFGQVEGQYEAREAELGPELMREFEKVVLLRVVDQQWTDHIDAMEQLRQGIHLRGYAQTDPLREYQFEGFAMFEAMILRIEDEVVRQIMKAQVTQNVEREAVAVGQIASGGGDGTAARGKAQATRPQPVRVENKIGRNDPCPCGSGKKYKNCCGA